jgi:hypothetical protein
MDVSVKKTKLGIGNLLPKVPFFFGGNTEVDSLSIVNEPRMHSHTYMNDPNATLSRRKSSGDQGLSFTKETLYRKMGIRQNISSTKNNTNVSNEKSSITGSGDTLSSNTSTLCGSETSNVTHTYKFPRGTCIWTKYGSGMVLDFRTQDGFYIVQLVPKSIAYLHKDAVIREIKSIVGERVKTRWGLATVENYYPDEDIYSIALDWRWDDEHVWRMKATTKKFDKIQKNSMMQNMQNTKNYLFEGYSTLKETTSASYANVVAKLNTTNITTTITNRSNGPNEPNGPNGPNGTTNEILSRKAMTPYGVCTVIEFRADNFFVVKTAFGATAYLNPESVKFHQRRSNFIVGERVKSPYGEGQIVHFREEDEMYEIKLDFASMLYITDVNAETQLQSDTSSDTTKRISSFIISTRKTMTSASVSMKISASEGLSTLKAKVSTMATYKSAPKLKYNKGERVITSLGSGFIQDVRPTERIYTVQLRRLKCVGYFYEDTLSPFPYDKVTHLIVDGKTIPAPDSMPRTAAALKRRDVIQAALKSVKQHGT